MKSILLVEDDKSLNQGIALKLKKEGYRVSSVFSLGEAEELFDSAAWDLIICDVGLPDGSGLDFCRKVRQVSDVFILFLTALDSEIDMVTAYDLGADDYMTKPFSLMVLVSKVHAFMRRQKRLLRSGSSPVTSSFPPGDEGFSAEAGGGTGAYPSEQKRAAASPVPDGKCLPDPYQGTDTGAGVGHGGPVCG